MAEAEKFYSRVSTLGRIWSWALVRRLLGLVGLAMIILGYGLIMGSSEAGDVQGTTQRAITGMVLVASGGVLEALVLLAWARR